MTYVVGAGRVQASSRLVPSTHTRTPSSAVTVKVVSPPEKANWPTQRAEKLSAGTGAPGPASPSRSRRWRQVVASGVPESVVLPEVLPRN